MARRIKVSASVLNIQLHPHSADIYRRWIEKVFANRVISPVHGDRHGVISLIDRSDVENGVLTGTITTFVKFDEGGAWFNAEQLTEASEEEISEVKIPNNLFPNASAFYFNFNLQKHHLYFQTYSKGKLMTPSSALRFFRSMAQNIRVMEEFGEAKISIIQDTASLSKMFSIKRIKEIEISIFRPNPDVFRDDFEENIENHLSETNSREVKFLYRSEVNGSIKPDDDIQKVSEYAFTNGEVSVKGRDEKGAVKLNSQNFPLEMHDRYDPDAQTERQAFNSLISPLGIANN